MGGNKKWSFCPSCNDKKWCGVVSGFYVKCRDCNSEFDLRKAKKLAKQTRDIRTGELGKKIIYGHKECEERDFAYMAWIKMQRCCVPGCKTSQPVHAHHAVHKSQQGSDKTCVPLCPFHHMVEYHGKLGSVEKFKEVWGIDLIEVAGRMRQNFEKINH